MATENSANRFRMHFPSSHQSRVLSAILKTEPKAPKRTYEKYRMDYVMLILGWLLGIVASTYIIEGGSISPLEPEHVIVTIVVCTVGLVTMNKLVTPILSPNDQRSHYPLWWTFSIGISAGVIGRLLTVFLTNPMKYIEEITNIFKLI